jgi:Na+-driven multidrug efflux pump
MVCIERMLSADVEPHFQVVDRTLKWALSLGLFLAVALLLLGSNAHRPFTSDPAVIRAMDNIFPWVVLSQPINALAFVWDGILYGAGGFQYAAKVGLPLLLYKANCPLPSMVSVPTL